MRKKHLKGLLAGCLTGVLLTACSRDMDQPGPNPDGDVVRIQLDAPEAMQLTRGDAETNSAKGALTNVDWAKYDLRYQLAVYSEDGSTELFAPQTKVCDTYSPVVFDFRLTPNNTYKFVAWADFVEQGSTTDLHYNTSNFVNIKIKTQGNRDRIINDESRDAYFVTKNISITQSFNESLTLKRPFAKVRVVTTDWDENNKGVMKPDNFKITYHDCTRFSSLNAVTGEAFGEADLSTAYTAKILTDDSGEKYYTGGYDASATNRTLLVDYLLATPEQQAIHFNLDMLAGNTPVISRDFKTEIPVQRNYLTTIIGNLLSVGGSITIDIDENFDGTENTVEVKDPKYITYTATQEMDYEGRFWGSDFEFIADQCTYNTETGEGKWAYTGTITYITDAAFSGETSLQEITIPASVVEVGRNLENGTGGGGAFQGCTSLTKVVFEGNNINKINLNTFNGCSALSVIDLPASVKTIEYNAFQRCSALEKITIPDAVTVIEKQVFSQCEALRRVNFGTQLESIGTNAFNRCFALEVVVCPDETPATLSGGVFPVSDSWGSYTANYKIYVPDAQLDTYRTSWPAYWDTSSWVPTKVIYPMSEMPTE